MPRAGRWATPQLTIDEITDAPGAQPQRHQRRHEVGQAPEPATQAVAVPDHREDDPSRPPWKDMPPSQIRSKAKGSRDARQIIEQHTRSRRAQDHAERDVGGQVAHLLRRQGHIGALGAGVAEVEPPQDADQIGQAIPVDAQRAQLQGDGVDGGRSAWAPWARRRARFGCRHDPRVIGRFLYL